MAFSITRELLAQINPGLNDAQLDGLLNSYWTPDAGGQEGFAGYQPYDDPAYTFGLHGEQPGSAIDMPAGLTAPDLSNPEQVQPFAGGFAVPEGYSQLLVGAPDGGNPLVSTNPAEIDEYNHNEMTRDLQGIAKIGGLVGGAALGGTTAPGSSASGLGPNGLPTAAGFPAAPLTGGTGAVGGGLLSGVTGGAGGLAGLGGEAANVIGGGAGYDPFANMPSNVDDVMTVTGKRPDLTGGLLDRLLDGLPDISDAIGDIAQPILGGTEHVESPGSSGVPDWLKNYLMPALNGIGGYLAADKSTDAEAASLREAIAEQKRQYDLTRGDQMPWLDAGTSALAKLSDPRANFEASPDYEYVRNEGMRGLDNRASAAGGLLSGNALKSLTEYNSGLATQDYNNWYGNRLNLAGLGSDSAKSLGVLGANSANATSSLLGGIGDARSTGLAGKWGSILSGLNQGVYRNAYGRP